MAFRLSQYSDMLQQLLASARSFWTVAEFLGAPDRRSIILRHDVDRHVNRAYRMAQLESSLGVRSSYYFRFGKSGFPDAAIREIAGLGHEVGFHYETLSDAHGDRSRATDAFLEQLASFRRIAECRTVCAHGRPLNRWFSGDMADELVEQAAGLVGDASAHMPRDAVIYLTDAGGRWNDPGVNLRDKAGEMPLGVDPLKPLDLQKLLDCDASLYVSTHSERWCDGPAEYGLQSAVDTVAGMVKAVLRRARL